MELYKDESLDTLALAGNVAQFVSFAPTPDGNLSQRFCRIHGFEPNQRFGTVKDALTMLLSKSVDGTINLRSFTPGNPRSREFVYGISSVDDAEGVLNRLISDGLFVIANETVDISDGGVSGVAQGEILEFAPDDTPRCVEKAGVCALPRDWAIDILSTVYGFHPEIGDIRQGRVEFSIHPKKRGWKNTHTLLWEFESVTEDRQVPPINWPNRFSRHLGDKAFGLLIADKLGLRVPRTTVIGRRVAPFSFGWSTGSNEVWTRTCPLEPEPGRFTTVKGWIDPFKLMASEDPSASFIASVLCQEAVPAAFSGAAVVTIDGSLVIEGKSGEGDGLMLGRDRPEALPESVISEVKGTYEHIRARLGPVRFEWVHDGDSAWIVQLHRGQTNSSTTILVPGDAVNWREFDPTEGLESLRTFLATLRDGEGVKILGDVGLTSHLADVVRKAKHPAKIAVNA